MYWTGSYLECFCFFVFVLFTHVLPETSSEVWWKWMEVYPLRMWNAGGWRKIGCWIFEYLTRFWVAAPLESLVAPAGNHQRTNLLYLSYTFNSWVSCISPVCLLYFSCISLFILHIQLLGLLYFSFCMYRIYVFLLFWCRMADRATVSRRKVVRVFSERKNPYYVKHTQCCCDLRVFEKILESSQPKSSCFGRAFNESQLLDTLHNHIWTNGPMWLTLNSTSIITTEKSLKTKFCNLQICALWNVWRNILWSPKGWHPGLMFIRVKEL